MMRYLVLLGFSLSLAFGQKDGSYEPRIPKHVLVKEAVSFVGNVMGQFGVGPYCEPQHSLVLDESFNDINWNSGGFKDTKKYLIDDETLLGQFDSTPSFTHELSVSVVFPHEGSWKLSNVEEELIELQRVYAKCGIKIKPEIFQTTLPSGDTTVLYEKGAVNGKGAPDIGSRDYLGAKTPIDPTSAGVYLFDRFSDNLLQPGTSSPQWNNPEGCTHLNYSWVGFHGSLEKTEKYKWFKYSVLAHEMTHNLANVGHGPNFYSSVSHYKDKFDQNCNDPTKYNCMPKIQDDDPSIMNGAPASRNADLSIYLCERILSHPNVKEIKSKVN